MVMFSRSCFRVIENEFGFLLYMYSNRWKIKAAYTKKKYSIGMKVEHEIRLYAEDKYMYSM